MYIGSVYRRPGTSRPPNQDTTAESSRGVLVRVGAYVGVCASEYVCVSVGVSKWCGWVCVGLCVEGCVLECLRHVCRSVSHSVCECVSPLHSPKTPLLTFWSRGQPG